MLSKFPGVNLQNLRENLSDDFVPFKCQSYVFLKN